MSPAEKAAKDDAKCKSYGLKPGTDMFIACRMKQDEIRADYRGRVTAAAIASGPTYCSPAGNGVVCY